MQISNEKKSVTSQDLPHILKKEKKGNLCLMNNANKMLLDK